MGERPCEGKTEKPYSGSDKESIQRAYCRKKHNLENMQKSSLSILHNTDASLCGLGLSILYERWPSRKCICSPFTSNCSFKSGRMNHGHRLYLSVQRVDSGCYLGVRGVGVHRFEGVGDEGV